MKLTALLTAMACFTLPTLAQSQEPQNITAFDYLIGYEELIGKTVKVTDCIAYGVNIDFFLCSVKTETSSIDTIYINLKNTPKKQLSYGLKKCGSIMDAEADICTATIVGLAEKTSDGSASINAKEITWQGEK